MHYQHQTLITGAEAAALLGVSRRTIYRWVDEGRLALPLTRENIQARMPQKRRRGPKPNRWSIRYVTGRHRWPYE